MSDIRKVKRFLDALKADVVGKVPAQYRPQVEAMSVEELFAVAGIEIEVGADGQSESRNRKITELVRRYGRKKPN